MLNKTTLTRWLFLFGSIIIISLIAWNTYLFINELKESERIKMEIWAAAQEEIREVNLTSESTNNNMIIKVLQSNTTTPMILYTHKENIYVAHNIIEKPGDSLQQRKEKEKLAKLFSAEYQPIEVRYKEELLQTIYYGNSPLINKLKYYPAVLVLIILLFFLALYFYYQTSKSSEQNKLWAGMAKETAHQIGTPLSSLVGWAEILKTENVKSEYIVEIEKDISRLNTITERFSKIGSIPKLEKLDIVAETRTSFEYLRSRTSKLIEFELIVPKKALYVDLNPQLYSWTIENLVKNGIDAMRGQGKITLEITSDTKRALVQISDTGKGIPKRNQKRIFKPGFTTKKRGWGLGLSLAKRIIESYHKGRIYVLKSTKDIGTTIEIAIVLHR